MSRVKVHQADGAHAAVSNPLFGQIEAALEAIRRRAFELFEKRGCAPNGDVDDWLQAEKDLFFIPQAEMHESEKGFRLTISAPGFDAGDIDIIALPRELLVEAKIERRLEPKRDSMRAGDLESRTLYRRFELAAPIDTGRVTARIDEGSLAIEVPKKLAERFPARAAAA